METRQEKIARLQSILANPTVITPLTADQKRGIDAARLSRLDTSKELEDARALQEQEDQERSISLGNAITTAGDMLASTGDAVSHIPTPGSIATPLIILLVFFLALIPIAGNTRLKWLWLVVSGNADMAAGIASGDITPPGTSKDSASSSTPSYSIGIIPYMSLEV